VSDHRTSANFITSALMMFWAQASLELSMEVSPVETVAFIIKKCDYLDCCNFGNNFSFTFCCVTTDKLSTFCIFIVVRMIVPYCIGQWLEYQTTVVPR